MVDFHEEEVSHPPANSQHVMVPAFVCLWVPAVCANAYIKALLTCDISQSMLLMMKLKNRFFSKASGVYKLCSEPCLTLLLGAAKPEQLSLACVLMEGFIILWWSFLCSLFPPKENNGKILRLEFIFLWQSQKHMHMYAYSAWLLVSCFAIKALCS